MMRSGEDDEVPNPNCCLLLNFFLLFGASYILGVIFLHYSASILAAELPASVDHTHTHAHWKDIKRRGLYLQTVATGMDWLECSRVCGSQCGLSTLKMFLYTDRLNTDSTVRLYPNRTVAYF